VNDERFTLVLTEETLEEKWVLHISENDSVTASMTETELQEVADEWIAQAAEEGDTLNRKDFLIHLRAYHEHLKALES
jgi:hypothetical protein